MIKIIIMSLMIFITVFTYLIILGASMNKSDEERKAEDEEQMKYLREYKKRRNVMWKLKLAEEIFTMLN